MPWGGTWASLSWRRLDTQRALRLPLELLEGLTQLHWPEAGQDIVARCILQAEDS